MTKKQKKKRPSHKQTAKHRRRSSGSLWQRHQTSMRRLMIWGIPVIVVLLGVTLVFSYMQGKQNAKEKVEYTYLAHQQLLRGELNEAEVSYHIAQNADPHDKQLSREATMLQAKKTLATGGSLDNAIAAANTVLAYDSNSVVAQVTLAMLYNREGDVSKVEKFAGLAYTNAKSKSDTLAMLMASISLSSYFRQVRQPDPAYAYARKADSLAEMTGDTFDLAMAKSTLAFSALKVDSLEQAKNLFQRVEQLSGQVYQPFFDLAQVGLSEYFFLAGEYDSCIVHATYVENLYKGLAAPNTNYASAIYYEGKALAAKGEDQKAIEKLLESAQAWQALSGYSDLIDNINDLGDLYLREKDYANARKYYLAAAKVEKSYGLPQQSKLDIDLNNLFLQNLTKEDYVRAGKEGDSLAADILENMDFAQ
jgi:hypothetical protein